MFAVNTAGTTVDVSSNVYNTGLTSGFTPPMTMQLFPNRTVYITDSLGNIAFNSEIITPACPVNISNNNVMSALYTGTYMEGG